MRTKSPDARLYVQNVCVNIKDKEILKDVSMVSKTGEMLAVMGPTGSGKTTLLNAMSGRQLFKSGTVTLNGAKFDKRLRRRLAFVQQQDVFFSQLTLKETLVFTSQLRMSDKITDAEKQSIIDDIVDRLHIRTCLNTVIGDCFVKGLSGGEKKRASIACELLVDPDILLLDEPTSGLDSSTAFDIMSCLKSFATDFNKMIVITIHQPASRLFHMFDNLLLLAKGQIAYFGTIGNALPYFEELDIHCALHYNPADFLLEAVTSDDDSIKRIINKGSTTKFQKFSNSSVRSRKGNKAVTENEGEGLGDDKNNDEAFEEEDEREDSTKKLISNGFQNGAYLVQFEDYDSIDDDLDKWPTSWCTQYCVLTGRSLKQTLRVIKQGYSLTTAIIVSVTCCLLYTQVGVSLQTSRDVYGLIFFYGGYWTFLPAMEIISSFPAARLVINKERAAGAYRLSALYCALMTSNIPNCLLHPIIMYILFFWVGGFGGASHFFSTLGCYIIHTWACYGLGLFISALCHDLRMAITTLFSYLISMYLLGGFFSQNVPAWMSWIKYLSIFFYPYAFSIKIISEQIQETPCNETSMVTFPQCTDNSTLYISSNDVLEKANVVFPLHFYILIIIAYTVALRIVGYFTLLYKRSNPVRKSLTHTEIATGTHVD